MNRPLLSNAFLFFSFATLILADETITIPTSLVEGIRPGEKSYVMELFVGTPPEIMNFEITFKHDLVILYRDQSLHSVTYSPSGGGSEIFYFGSQHYRINTVEDPARHLYGEHSQCRQCSGMIGLGQGSFFWQLWPDASFTSSSITVGGINPLLQNRHGFLIRCDNDLIETPECMCKTEGVIQGELGGIVHKSYPICISVDNPLTHLPQDIYDRYMIDKNVYSGNVSKWQPLQITLSDSQLEMDPHKLAHILSKGIYLPSDKSVDIHIDPKRLIKEFEVEGKFLLMVPNQDSEDDTITIGNSIWNQFIMYRSPGGDFLFMKHHTVVDHFDALSLLVFSALIWYLVRWKMTDITMKIDKTFVRRNSWLNIFYEVTAPILGLVALLLPITRDIVSDFPELYFISIAIFSFSVIVEIIVIPTVIFDKRLKNLKTSKRDTNTWESKHLIYHAFRLNFLRNLAHETILMISIWVILVERRSEGVATVLTVLVNIYNLYNITFHSIIFLLFYIYTGKNGRKSYKSKFPSILWLTIAIALPILLGFQAFAAYNYFTAPLLKRSAQIYTELILPTLIVGIFLIITVAAHVVSIYLNRAILAIVEIHKREEEEAKKSDDPLAFKSSDILNPQNYSNF